MKRIDSGPPPSTVTTPKDKQPATQLKDIPFKQSKWGNRRNAVMLGKREPRVATSTPPQKPLPQVGVRPRQPAPSQKPPALPTHPSVHQENPKLTGLKQQLFAAGQLFDSLAADKSKLLKEVGTQTATKVMFGKGNFNPLMAALHRPSQEPGKFEASMTTALDAARSYKAAKGEAKVSTGTFSSKMVPVDYPHHDNLDGLLTDLKSDDFSIRQKKLMVADFVERTMVQSLSAREHLVADAIKPTAAKLDADAVDLLRQMVNRGGSIPTDAFEAAATHLVNGLAGVPSAAARDLVKTMPTDLLQSTLATLDQMQKDVNDRVGIGARLPGLEPREAATVLRNAINAEPAVKRAMEMKVKVATAKATRTTKPHGIILRQNGQVGGTSRITHTLGGAKTMQAALQEKGQYYLDPSRVASAGDQAISAKALADLPRMHLTIPDGSGDGFDTYKAANETTAGKLRDFAGSDQATTVLSGVLNQYMLRELHSNFHNAAGDKIDLKLANTRIPTSVKDAGGTSHDVGKPTQYAAANMRLSKTPEGNFKIDIDWPMYFTGFRGADEADLPLHENGSLEARFTTSWVVDADQAAAGNLSLTVAQPLEVAYSGSMTWF